MQNDIVCHEIVRRPSYWSNIFSTQIFQELLEHVRDGFTRPGIRHADPNTVDMLQSEGTWSALMVMGITG